jgi:nucleoid DNA-binding protein
MNELINVIVQKTGISQENAQKAVQVTVDFLKSKLPGPIAVQLNSFLMGGTNLSRVLAGKG